MNDLAIRLGTRRVGWIFIAYVAALGILTAVEAAFLSHPIEAQALIGTVPLGLLISVIGGLIKFLREHRKDAEDDGWSESLRTGTSTVTITWTGTFNDEKDKKKGQAVA